MSAALRQRQSQSANPQGKAARVAEYIREEFPVPRGQPTGLMLQKEDRKLAAIILSVSQALWFITVSVGIVYYSGSCKLVCCFELAGRTAPPFIVSNSSLASKYGLQPRLKDCRAVVTTAVSAHQATQLELKSMPSIPWFGLTTGLEQLVPCFHLCFWPQGTG